ncbi:MAG: hypothetical protein HFJ37_06455 [Clostridia bacterium]|nr:hypothetical protein [Clostridia bacterium]
MKNNKGITLIALVITIIVLLILAGVSIAMLTGNNGVLTQAKNASSDTKVAEAKESVSLKVNELVSEFYEEKYVNSNTAAEMASVKTYIEANLTSEEGLYNYDTANKTITIIPVNREGKQETGTIDADGAITWTNPTV